MKISLNSAVVWGFFLSFMAKAAMERTVRKNRRNLLDVLENIHQKMGFVLRTYEEPQEDSRNFIECLKEYGAALTETKKSLETYGNNLNIPEIEHFMLCHQQVFNILFDKKSSEKHKPQPLQQWTEQVLHNSEQDLEGVKEQLDAMPAWKFWAKPKPLKGFTPKPQKKTWLRYIGLDRLGNTFKGTFGRLPATFQVILTILIPTVFTFVNSYVADHAKFGGYLGNNIRLAYENFYLIVTASTEPDPQLIRKRAEILLDIIDKRYDVVPNLKIEDYGKDNQFLISVFIFILRTIPIVTLRLGEIPKYLPNPKDIRDIAYTIQDFMSDHAWRSFLFPKSMRSVKIELPKEYFKVSEQVKKDPKLHNTFYKECDEECWTKIQTLLKNP